MIIWKLQEGPNKIIESVSKENSLLVANCQFELSIIISPGTNLNQL